MLSGPPLDGQGEVVPHDHHGIKDADGVIRRVSPQFVVADPKTGPRISTLALKPSSGPNGGLSVDLRCEIESAGYNPMEYVMSPPWIGAIHFQAGVLRAEALKVGFHPLADQPFHGEVWGDFTRSRQKRLLTVASWFVPLPGVALG